MIGHSAQSSTLRVAVSQDRLHQLGARPQKAAALLFSKDPFSFKSDVFLGTGHPGGLGRGMISPCLSAQLKWARKAALQAVGTAATFLAPG